MITVYGKPHCPYCVMAYEWLLQNQFDFQKVDVLENPEALVFIKSEGHKTVPQIYQDGELLVSGGYSGMVAMGAEKLAEKIKS